MEYQSLLLGWSGRAAPKPATLAILRIMCPVGSIAYSVVVPIYGNEATLPELLAQLAQLRREYAGDFEVVFVVDGSPDNSHALLKLRLPQMPFASQLVAL